MSGATHLELEEREQLAALKAEGLSLRAIAARLGRAASTVSRELRRNALPKGGYLPVHAEGCYCERRQRPAILERDAKLGRFVRERLLEGWTPEQIAGWLKRGEERGLRTVSTETIYAFLHRAGQKAEKLWKLLPRGRAKRARRRARQPRSTIAERRSIHDRPEAVHERKEAGHWEGDLLICRRTRPVLVLKERKTRFVLAARLAGKSAAETVAIMMAVFRRLDPRLRASVTFDNDTAFARHGLLASACAMTTLDQLRCSSHDAYVSWQKGAVENANGRLRRDLPRDLDLDALGDAELQEIVLTHNLTPRKCLGFLTPLQALLKELGRDVQIRFA
jgi:transposase, IS30 family